MSDPIPDTSTVETFSTALDTAIDTYGFIPADTVAQVASNTRQSFAYSTFAVGFPNAMTYLKYI